MAEQRHQASPCAKEHQFITHCAFHTSLWISILQVCEADIAKGLGATNFKRVLIHITNSNLALSTWYQVYAIIDIECSTELCELFLVCPKKRNLRWLFEDGWSMQNVFFLKKKLSGFMYLNLEVGSHQKQICGRWNQTNWSEFLCRSELLKYKIKTDTSPSLKYSSSTFQSLGQEESHDAWSFGIPYQANPRIKWSRKTLLCLFLEWMHSVKNQYRDLVKKNPRWNQMFNYVF